MSGEICGDDRFELIAKAKQKLLDATNIEGNQTDMAALDSILFRCWQMGWLDQLRDADTRWHELFGTPERAARTLHHNGTQICSECLIRDECAKTPEDSKCMILHYDALLEWLRGDA